jgi:hypothetical protein
MAHPAPSQPPPESVGVRHSNPIVDYLEHMTAEEEAALRYAVERDRATANDPDPDALLSEPGRDPLPDRPNPFVAFLDAMTPREEASLRRAFERAQSAPEEPDPDALPSPC